MDELLSTVKLFACNYVPMNYLPCDGRALQVNQHQALYALIGTTFGGHYPDTFNLPKLEAPQGLRYGICIEGVWPSRD